MDMLIAINSVRVQGTTCDNVFQNSINNVSWNYKLAGAAKTLVKDILNRTNSDTEISLIQALSHVDSSGNRVDQRVKAQGYNYQKLGEILAALSNGSASIDKVIKSWQNSPRHCHVIMASSFKDIGIYFESGIWAVVFGNPSKNMEPQINSLPKVEETCHDSPDVKLQEEQSWQTITTDLGLETLKYYIQEKKQCCC